MRRSSLNLAQRAMAVGPAAPARTARTAMTRMLGSGCRRLIWERGSSRVEKDATISSSLLRVLVIADLRPQGLVRDTEDGIPKSLGEAQARKVYQIVIKVRAGPGLLLPSHLRASHTRGRLESDGDIDGLCCSCQPSPSAGLLVGRFKIDGYKKVAGQAQGKFRQWIAD